MKKPKALPVRIRDANENVGQLVDLLDVLDIGFKAFNEGRQAAWMICSGYLHQLLNDGANGNTPVALRVIPNLRLHPMRHDYSKSPISYLMSSPVSISSSRQGIVLKIFDLSEKRMPLAEWVTQYAYVQYDSDTDTGVPITIKELITTVRHQAGGAHFDPAVYKTLSHIETIFASMSFGEHPLTFRNYLVAIAEYVHSEITSQLMEYIGNARLVQEKYEEAQGFYTAALDLTRKSGSLEGMCEQLRLIGIASLKTKQYRQAVKHLEETLTLARQLSSHESEQNALHNLTVTYTELGNQRLTAGDPEEALSLYETGIDIAKQRGDADSQDVLQKNVALAYSRIYERRITSALTGLITGIAAGTLLWTQWRSRTTQ